MRNFDEEGEYANLAGIRAKLWRESAPPKYYVEPAPRAAAGRPWKTLDWGEKGGESLFATRIFFWREDNIGDDQTHFQSCGTFFYIR